MGSSQGTDIYAETLAVFDRREDRCEPLTTLDVADALDANRRTVYKRLRTLADRGAVRTKSVGSNARVWWRPPAYERSTSSETPGEHRDRELERRSRMMESAIDGIAITDDDGEYVYVNESHVEVYGYDDATAFLGDHWSMCYPESELDRFEAEIIPTLYEDGAWRGEVLGQRQDGSTFTQDLSLTVADDDGIICVVRDITERKEQERRLRDARQFNEELVENAPFGTFRLDEELRITYENPRAEEIIGLPDDMESSDAIGVDIRTLPPIVETGQADLFDRLQEGETIEFDFPFESIYGKKAYFTGRAVPVYRDGEFDGAILMATDISERRQYERELERQREQLAALDELNDVVRGITEAVIEQSTRAEIERVVCDRLAASDSYRGAWIGAVDAGPGVEPRVEAGVEGYLDDIAAAAGENEGLVGEAVRTAELQIVRNAQEDGRPLHDDAREVGYRAAAVIPVVHGGIVYDVLGVCSTRPDAFAAEERAVLGQLGDVIGHAITAVDRKRALMSDEVVELDIRIPGLVEHSRTIDGTITIDRVTPVGDDEFLVYGTATGDAMTTIRALRDDRSDWTELRTFDEQDGRIRFEQRLADPPLTSIVADYGGNVEGGTIEDGEYSATVQFPPGTNVRRVVERLQETPLEVRVVSQRQVIREHPSSQRVLHTLAENLTERQRAALEAGYFGGFFAWPRHRSGEDIAASLDIGASTFHQHVRKAERKLLDVVFAEL
ncbi:bacterio-opsin activator domain-containing protein [Haloplanus natans]|uniref:bacterio-opsin activator domain-containing protein n=1 Tax=Haloplanus natans TaxID=376171 RepID=UPI000677F070|nr:bacterio-opsin activator domain-containing protein [Haloplanus natans]